MTKATGPAGRLLRPRLFHWRSRAAGSTLVSGQMPMSSDVHVQRKRPMAAFSRGIWLNSAASPDYEREKRFIESCRNHRVKEVEKALKGLQNPTWNLWM